MGVASSELKRQLYYRKRPVDWAVDYMGVDEKTIRWSLNEEYEDHEWDGDKDPLVGLANAVSTKTDDRRIAVTSGVGTGKASPLDTEVLTTDGWVEIGNLTSRHKIYGSDGKPHRLTGIYPQGVKDEYEVTFSDGSSVKCCGEHLWTWRDRASRGWRTSTTLDLKQDIENGYRREIPIASPIEKEEKEFPISPYILGCLIGDGGLTAGVTMFSGDEEIIDSIRQELDEGLEIYHYDRNGYPIVTEENKGLLASDVSDSSKNPLAESLRKLGLFGKKSHKKFIPERYFHGSISQREKLLQGLMDTDGTISSGSVTFCTTSDKLREDFERLVNSLGGVTSECKVRDANQDVKANHDSYRHAVRLPNSIEPFNLSRKAEKYNPDDKRSRPIRKIESIERTGQSEMACISVDATDSLYITENHIVTHNTFEAAWLPLWFCDCYRPSFVATVAPKEDQLKKNLWKEIDSTFWPKFSELHPQAKKLSLEVRMKPDEDRDDDSGRSDWKVTGYVAGVGAEETTAVKARGFHQQHMLIIFEEMTGVNKAVVKAFKDTCVAPHNIILGLGNPDDENDPLSKLAQNESSRHIRISAYDHPNVVKNNPTFVPGAVTEASIQEKVDEVSGDKSDGRFQSRVRGLIPTVSSRSLFKQKELEGAKKHLKKKPIQRIEHDHRDGIEGFTEIYFPPEEDYLSKHILFMDVAGESDKDYHGAVLWNRLERRPDAIIRMRGLGAGYIEAALTLAQRFSIKNETGTWTYPLMVWETNGVGAHFPRIDIEHPEYDSLSDYPNIYFRRNLDAAGANTRKTWGFRTTGGQSGTRRKMIEELQTWARELLHYPERMVSRYIYEEAKNFIKQEHRGRKKYMAAPGHTDDLMMALGGAMVLDRSIQEPMPYDDRKSPDNDPELNPRMKRAMKQANLPGEQNDPFEVEYDKF